MGLSMTSSEPWRIEVAFGETGGRDGDGDDGDGNDGDGIAFYPRLASVVTP